MLDVRKIFLLGDLHLGVKSASSEWLSMQKEFLLDFFLKKVDEEGFDEDRDILVQLGDWHHVRESTNTKVLKDSIDIASALTKKFKRGVYIILGNHDVYYKDRNDLHSLMGLDRMFSNLTVFTRPESKKIGKHSFLFLPWNDNVTSLTSSLQSAISEDNVFCHADVKGAYLNKFTSLEHGLESESIEQFRRVYSGHIHIRQEIGKVLYVGTPYELDRGDRANTKGFYVLDVSGPEITETFIENTVSPKYVRYEMTDVLNASLDDIKKLFNNNYVDLAIESVFSSRFPFTQFTELVEECGHKKIEPKEYTVEERTKGEKLVSGSTEYDLFSVLSDHLVLKDLNEDTSSFVQTRFREIYDSLNEKKRYDK